MSTVETQPKLPTPNPNEIVDLAVEELLLDLDNPRLAWKVDSNGQENLLKILWTEMSVDEVAWSIAENGFFRSEPLFVVIEDLGEASPEKRRYIVIEGNRRLAAVILLRDQRLREKVGATDLPKISEERRVELSKLPAIIYLDRKSLWAPVGFRHINGIKPWDSFSKARYIAEVYEMYQVPLEDIAEKIGDRHLTVKRLYRGYKVLEQAESQKLFSKEDGARNRFYFSHLYTAVDQKAFQDFLGIDPNNSLKPNPVPKPKLKELEELMTWLYGKRSAGIDPVVRKQNPDLNRLREVIENQASLSLLRTIGRLDTAYDAALGDSRRFRDALTRAKLELQNAKATVTTGYKGEEDLYDTITDIVSYAESIRSEMGTQKGPDKDGPIRQPSRRRK